MTALAGLATGADKLPYFTGNDAAGRTDLYASVGRDISSEKPVLRIFSAYLPQFRGGNGKARKLRAPCKNRRIAAIFRTKTICGSYRHLTKRRLPLRLVNQAGSKIATICNAAVHVNSGN